MAEVSGVPIGLAADGTLLRFADGGWTRWSDVSAIRPQALSVAGGVPLVVGLRGIVRGTSGTFVTRDGGASVVPLPTPGAQAPALASLTGGGRGAVVLDPVLGSAFRSPALLTAKAPSLRLTAAGKVKRTRATRRVTVIGILDGARSDGPVAVVSVDRRGRPVRTVTAGETNADGSIRFVVTLARREHGLRAFYRGAVRPAGTSLGAASRVLRVR